MTAQRERKLDGEENGEKLPLEARLMPTANQMHEVVDGDQRTRINTLPSHLAQNFTPYFNLEFNSSVQNYCRQQANHIIISSSSSSNKHNNAANIWTKKKYDSVCAPFSKIVRNCKVVVCGDVAVGKTCLVSRASGGQTLNHALKTYQTTIGVDFDLKRYTILGQSYVLQLWDTAGLERFRCITSSYYRGCQVALIVFDVSNMSTLANVMKWRDEIVSSYKTYEQMSESLSTGDEQVVKLRPSADDDHEFACGGGGGGGGERNGEKHEVYEKDDVPLLFLVGTKCDLPISSASRAFISEQANKLAALLNAELWFVSAATGENVHEMFQRIAALSFERTILNELRRLKFEASTMGTSLREKFVQQQRLMWAQSSKLIKITKKKQGDERRSRCVNIQCVIK